MKFVMKVATPLAVAYLVDDRDWCWPFYDLDHAREVARDMRHGGIWKVKRLKAKS